MYRDFGAPRRTRSHLCSSGPSDQPADRANHSRTIFPSEIQRITGLSCTGVPCLRSHHSITQSTSLLSPATPSLSSDLPSPATASLKPTTERSPSSYKAKPLPVSALSPLYLAGNGPRFVGCHRSFKSTILPLQPSTTVETTSIRILALRSTRSNHFLAGNLARKLHRRQQ